MPFVMLTDSTCALYTRKQYTYGSAAEACLHAVCLGHLNGVPGKFNGNITGKYKISAGTGSKLMQSQVTCHL